MKPFIWNPVWGIPLIGKINRQEACSIAERERKSLDEQVSLYLSLLAGKPYLVESRLSSRTLAGKSKVIINTMADPFSSSYQDLYISAFSLIRKGRNRERNYLLLTKEKSISIELPANVSVFSLSSMQFLQGNESLWQDEVEKLLKRKKKTKKQEAKDELSNPIVRTCKTRSIRSKKAQALQRRKQGSY